MLELFKNVVNVLTQESFCPLLDQAILAVWVASSLHIVLKEMCFLLLIFLCHYINYIPALLVFVYWDHVTLEGLMLNMGTFKVRHMLIISIE